MSPGITNPTPEQARGLIAALIVVMATALYVFGPADAEAQRVEPQSVFTLYGAVLGYMFGQVEGRRAERRRATDRREAGKSPERDR